MSKQIYVNLPVTDLAKSTDFYTALGFTRNPAFSNENASAMQWSDEIFVMILKHDFYSSFLKDKTIADSHTTSGVILAVTLDSKEDVQKFADTAKQSGGDYFKGEYGVSEDMMFGLEVFDPDGHHWEPVWMNPDFNPSA
jgi:predicted lactoylglutathione lyase